MSGFITRPFVFVVGVVQPTILLAVPVVGIFEPTC